MYTCNNWPKLFRILRKNNQLLGDFVASVNEIFADAAVDEMIDNIKLGVNDAEDQ